MSDTSIEQGELFGQRAKRSRVADPAAVRGSPPATTPGRRGAQFVTPTSTSTADAERRQLADQLEQIALAVGAEPDRKGGAFALFHVRAVAEARGILPVEPGGVDPLTDRMAIPRTLSWLGALLPDMQRRGLVEKVSVDGRIQYDTSEGARAHGNKNVLWKLTPAGRALADRRP